MTPQRLALHRRDDRRDVHLPNVYIGVGGNSWPYLRESFYGQFEQLVNAGFGERILVGSDRMHWPELIEISIDIIEAAPFLDEEQKLDKENDRRRLGLW